MLLLNILCCPCHPILFEVGVHLFPSGITRALLTARFTFFWRVKKTFLEFFIYWCRSVSGKERGIRKFGIRSFSSHSPVNQLLVSLCPSLRAVLPGLWSRGLPFFQSPLRFLVTACPAVFRLCLSCLLQNGPGPILLPAVFSCLVLGNWCRKGFVWLECFSGIAPCISIVWLIPLILLSHGSVPDPGILLQKCYSSRFARTGISIFIAP